MMLPLDNGLVHLISARSTSDTMSVLEAIVVGKNLRIMARIDHAKEAAEAGLQMRPAALLIFGNPRSGTPVMIASPSAAIDLPLKVLVWEDVEGRVWISYNSPRYLKERHQIPEDVMGNLAGIESICEQAACPLNN
jgi:uncharacterized protein (DUF302 family)